MSDLSSAAPAQLPVVLQLAVDAQAYQIVLPHAATDYIQKKLVADRVPYEKDMLDDMRARLKPGELVLDIGANIGNHTLYLAKVAGCRVESFEPNPELCAALRESLRLNSLDGSVHVHETGLGRQAGVARFGVDMPENLGGQHLSLGEGDLRVTTLDSCTFDGPASMLKIDVEGMELDVLEGGRALIARDRPLLYIECTNEAQFRIIARHLEPLDYTYWDTFNATPTHLFIPAERLSVEQRLQHLQAKAAQNDYRTHGQLRDARTALNEVNLKYRTLSEQLGTLKQKVAQEEAAKAAATARVADLQAQVDATAQQLAAQQRAHQEQVTALTRDLGTQSQTARDAEKLGIKSEVNLDNLRAQLEAANTKYRESTQRYAELKERLGQQDAARQAAASRQTELQALLDAAQRALEAERTERQAQIAALRAEVDTQRQAAHEAQKQAVRAETQLEGLRAQLDAANDKYREAGVRHAELKERLAQHESARQTALVRLAELQAQLDATGTSLASTSQALQDERSRSRDELAALTAEVQARGEATHAAQKLLIRAEAAVESLRAQLDAANLKYRDATQAHGELRERHGKEQAAHQATHGQLAGVRTELANTSRALETQAANATTLTRQLSDQTEAVHGALLRLAQTEATVETLRGQLDAANLKYRDVTQRQAELSAQHAEASAAHEAQRAALQRDLDAQGAATTETQARLQQTEQVAHDLRGQLDAANLKYRDALQRQAELSAQHAEATATHAVQLQQGEQAAQDLRDRLDAANLKYRDATQQHAVLSDRLAQTLAEQAALQTESALRLADATALRERLEGANGKYRDVTQQYAEVKDQLHQQQVARQAVATSLEQHKVDMLKAKQALTRAERDIERLKNQKLQAENQVAKTRATVSFQVGYAIVHGIKTWRGMFALPQVLWGIRQNFRTKKRQRAEPVLTAAAARRPAPVRLPRLERTPLAGGATGLVTAERLKALRVACIMDEFTFSSYQPECRMLQLTPTQYREELDGFKPEMLFIESAWRGKDGLWGSKVGHLSQEVQDILAWCREHHVPTVFWNKEDPIHFETFLTTARLFDHVFTTDIDCIHRYKAALGHEHVYLLPFAAQPALSNPIETYQRKDAFCFAGAYYVRYPERTRDLGNFVSELPQFKPVEIYDRNFGKDDANYQFPPEYQPFIVGNLPFEQIDKAYKGYRYAINLNSIKQSQSMFARRVFELLASNTVTVSNYSRGVRLMFGDLVFTTDSGSEILRRLRELGDDDVRVRKFRLAGLRKVMTSHTYQDRLAYVVSKVQGQDTAPLLPTIAVLAYAKNQEQFDALMASHQRQTHAERRLSVIVPNGFEPTGMPDDGRVEVLAADDVTDQTLADIAGDAALVAGIVPDDYHGPNYLRDLALATRYSTAQGYGKGSHHVWSTGSGLQVAYPGRAYTPATSLPARCSAARTALLAAQPVRDWVTSLYTGQIEAPELLCIDEFNYAKNGMAPGFDPAAVDDLPQLDTGIDFSELMARAERIAPEQQAADQAPVVAGNDLANWFKPPNNRGYTCTVDGPGWEFESTLADGKHEYLYASTDLRPTELGFTSVGQFHLDTTPGLNLQLVLLFLDAQKQRISSVVKGANRNQDVELPPGTEWVRVGIRIYGSGGARINGLVLGHRPLRPAEVLGRSEHLVLTNHYPSYDDLYRNGFVHSRVAAYAERGVKVDVFRLRKDEALSYHEFHDVDVITGSQEALHKLLNSGQVKNVLVHFLDEAMWEVLQHHIDRINVIVWVHGAEIQPWHRRDFNNENEEQRMLAKVKSETRMTFWRGLLKNMPTRLRLVFVSKYFAEEVMEDLGFRLTDGKYSIIHNPIDTDTFKYEPKSPELRRKILSIRPYASRTYANDLSTQAVLDLSSNPIFNELEFRFIGDGKLFNQTLDPLRKFKNVIIEQRFLNRNEIAELHKSYGIFLCPSRMDTQGVSRDEAMSSGLVPITNKIAAIPEFVSPSEGYLCQPENSAELAQAILDIATDASKFISMSIRSSERARNQSSKNRTIPQELNLLNG